MKELEKIDEENILGLFEYLGLNEADVSTRPRGASMIADSDEDEFETDDDALDTDDDGQIPETFLFESKIIFISNLDKVPQAVGDRCMTIQLNFTKDQALRLIESKLEHLCPEYPELTMKAKKEIIATMREFSKVVSRFSFRMFEKCAVLYMSKNPEWKQWARIQLRSMSSLT